MARKEAHAFRGELIDRFAQFERSLGPVLVLALSLPEYAAVAKKPAHLLGQKIEQLHKIVGTKGPLNGAANGIVTNLEALRRYEEARHFMAHATLEIIQAENDELLYLFRLTRAGKESVDQSTIVISKAEAKSIGSTLGVIVDRLTQQLDALGKPLRSKISQLPVAPPSLSV
ncbi:MAG: hypothetical protein CVT72_02800 [Alphaproteobacteria bacterium HGW-Alphaproteobacteria-11]|nr:MAG: hypothetical protein CVT72_02800 [Alphaproteobacteria bacterium HGW-Alphaproteobacteria-11]